MNTLPIVLFLLAASVIGVAIFRRFGLPPVLGYLAVGGLLAPHAGALLGDVSRTNALAEFGVVFLMFTLGLEFSLPRLFAMKRTVFGLGGAQVLVSMLVIGLLVWLGGAPWAAAVALGGALAMSSTAVLAKLLTERSAVDSSYGQKIVGVLLFQDLAVVPLLILVPALSQSPKELAVTLGIASLKAVLMLSLVLYFGQRLMGRWLHFVARGKSSELFVLNVLLVTLGLAWLTEIAGLSLALGAFVAGMLISETEFRHQVEEDIKPFRDVLLGLFFVTVGMLLDLKVLAEHWFWIGAALLGMLLVKGGLVWGLARLFKAAGGDSIRLGLWLCAGGEFGFVLLSEAKRSQVVPDALLQVVLAALVLSLLVAPFIVHFSEKIVLRLAASEWMLRSMQLTRIASSTMGVQKHAIICGFGRAGQHLSRFLAQEGLPWVALDLDPDRVRDAAAAGENVVFGDAARRETLIAAGLKRANVVVVTFADPAGAEKVIQLVHEVRNEIPVVVRVEDESHLERLYAAGAAEVVPEVLESSLMLASHAMILVGVPASRVLHRVRETRQQRYHLLRGLFHGVSDSDEELTDPGVRLHSVALSDGCAAVGRHLAELQANGLKAEVSAIRRRGIRVIEPGPETLLQAGDIVVLLGTSEQLAGAENLLLKG